MGWGLADQAISSITNFALGIVVARSLEVTDFGVFGLAWVTYAVILNVSRGLATDPLAVRFSGAPDVRWRTAVSGSTGTSILIGAVAGLCSVAGGAVVGGTIGFAFIALGVILPAVLLQDAWRFAFISGGESRKAFVNDVVWGVALIPCMFVASTQETVTAYLLAWGGSAAVAALYGCVQTRMLPRPTRSWSWLQQQRDLGPRYLVENTCVSGSAQLRLFGLGAIAGLADVGAVRGSELLIGPFMTVLMGLVIVSIPEAVRLLRCSPQRLTRFCLALGAVQATGALTWGLVLLSLPENVGSYLLGPIWPAAAGLIVPATVAVVNASFQTGAAVGLRALGASRRSMRVQLAASSAYAGFGIAGAFVAGATGSAWGVALATLVGALLWWWQLRLGLRDHCATSVPA